MKLVFLSLFLAATLNADVLLLRDGRRIDGHLVSVRDGVVEFLEETSSGGGRALRLDRDQVLGIEFGRDDRNTSRNSPQPSFQNGQRAGAGARGRSAGQRERQVMVAANVPWVDTGIDIQSGQDAYFEATGEVTWGPGRRHGPSGEPNSPTNPNRPMPNRPAATLIGRIGDSQDYFVIGIGGPIRARSTGRLYLAVNDDVLQDNSGAFRVIVYY